MGINLSQHELAIVLVLGAAFLHAFWNAMVKGAQDRTIALAMVNAGHVVPGILLVWFYLPPAQESWVFLAASTVIHLFYYWFLLSSFKLGDLSQVYPIARGVAPLTIALAAWYFVDENLPPISWAGLLLVTFGIGILLFSKSGKITDHGTNGKMIMAALATGMMIAAYSVVDGLGVRYSQSPLGYIGWLFVLEFVFPIAIFFRRRHMLSTIPARIYLMGFGGGLISSLAYGLAIYAKNLTTLGTVSAIRESSVIIAALIGVIWFGERPWKMRVLAACVVAGGVMLLALG